VGSSVNSTTNNFVKNLEKNIRSGKLGILFFSGGIKYPEKVEAFIKDLSKVIKYCFESFSRFLQWQTF
jgi:hypothetical protein